MTRDNEYPRVAAVTLYVPVPRAITDEMASISYSAHRRQEVSLTLTMNDPLECLSPTTLRWGPLRVINEDIVAPKQGFGKHPHRTFEIFSYPLEGSLRHDDSMGHSEIIGRGDVQFTSAGTGIAHSEYNASKEKQVKFLQIWLTPSREGLKPRYETKRFEDEEKADRLLPIVAQGGRGGAIACDNAAAVYASILSEGKRLTHEFDGGAAGAGSGSATSETKASGESETTSVSVSAASKSRVGYMHVPLVPGSTSKGLKLSTGVVLKPGDGAYVKIADGARGADASLSFEAVGGATEFILFDMTDA